MLVISFNAKIIGSPSILPLMLKNIILINQKLKVKNIPKRDKGFEYKSIIS